MDLKYSMHDTITQQIYEPIKARVKVIKTHLEKYHAAEKKIFATSSFQTQSLPLLHILSELDFSIPVYFIDTGFLFPETHQFKALLEKKLGLNIITLKSNVSKLMQVDQQHRFLFMTDPDRCCAINKILPMEEVLKSHDVWVNGVRESQSKVRQNFSEENQGKYGITRYHPLLRWTSKEIHYYSKFHQLPEHPLHAQGYESIGCIPCTAKTINMEGLSRQGRWSGMKKEECGLHTELMGTETK